jgi:hypothetical protein
MTHNHSINRREFLRLSSATVAAGLTGGLAPRVQAARPDTIEEAARIAGPFPRVKLGYSKRDISIMIGAGDLATAPAEAGILCGMNYWC